MVLLLNDFVESHLGKSKARSIHLKHLCSEKFNNMHERYTEFSEKCSEASEICHYLELIVRLWKLTKISGSWKKQETGEVIFSQYKTYFLSSGSVIAGIICDIDLGIWRRGEC